MIFKIILPLLLASTVFATTQEDEKYLLAGANATVISFSAAQLINLADDMHQDFIYDGKFILAPMPNNNEYHPDTVSEKDVVRSAKRGKKIVINYKIDAIEAQGRYISKLEKFRSIYQTAIKTTTNNATIKKVEEKIQVIDVELEKVYNLNHHQFASQYPSQMNTVYKETFDMTNKQSVEELKDFLYNASQKESRFIQIQRFGRSPITANRFASTKNILNNAGILSSFLTAAHIYVIYFEDEEKEETTANDFVM